jgi:hypothetical protein
MNSQVTMHEPRCAGPRVLIVVYGNEPSGWGGEVGRLLSMWRSPVVRVLAVIHVPAPPFTSLTPFSRKAFREALQSWKQEEEIRVHGVIDQIAPHGGGSIDVVQIRSARGRPESELVEHANIWLADVIVSSGPSRIGHSWPWPGRAHTRLLHDSPCPVMITKRGA